LTLPARTHSGAAPWSDDERASVLRAFASDDPEVVAEASALLAHLARSMRAEGRDPAEIVIVRISLDDAVRIARGE
jgi:hypothetical protein